MASYTRLHQPQTKLLLRSQPQKERAREQVAAVCFRFGSNGIDFLLVQTGGGRWTFPKGSTEPGLTSAQAAAMEAFEEAGVHGRIEEASFACYTGRKRDKTRRTPGTRLVVHAHLCEVLQLETPQESHRKPTWFPVEKAKQRLREARTEEDGTELVRVVDRAVARIQRVREGSTAPEDALQKVQFEAFQDARVQVHQASYRHIRRQAGANGHFAAVALAVDAYLCKVLRLASSDQFTGNEGLLYRERNNQEARPDRAPNEGNHLSLAAASPAIRLPQVCEGDGIANESPSQLQIVKNSTKRGTQNAGKRRGSSA